MLTQDQLNSKFKLMIPMLCDLQKYINTQSITWLGSFFWVRENKFYTYREAQGVLSDHSRKLSLSSRPEHT